MGLVIDALSWLALVGGALFTVIGGIGMLRMPDFYTRIHAASVTETGGMLLVMAGLVLQAPDFLVGVKLVLIAAFLLLTSPTAAHALAHAALKDGIKPGHTGNRRR